MRTSQRTLRVLDHTRTLRVLDHTRTLRMLSHTRTLRVLVTRARYTGARHGRAVSMWVRGAVHCVAVLHRVHMSVSDSVQWVSDCSKQSRVDLRRLWISVVRCASCLCEVFTIILSMDTFISYHLQRISNGILIPTPLFLEVRIRTSRDMINSRYI